MKESIEFLVVVGLLGLLCLLRLDAQRFGVAEYDDSDRAPGWRAWTRRLGWFLLGLGLVLLVYWLYPQPVTVLHLDMGPDRERALVYGLVAGVGGLILAYVFAWLRYGGFRLPAPRAYPGAIVNSVGTAVLDEAVFRGIMLGLLLHAGVSMWPAIAIQAVVYGAATRLWGKGRSKAMLLLDLVIGVVGGWLVVETGGIGAAVVAHAITRFGVFLATGHTDQVRPIGWEPEEVAGRALPPRGWDLVGDQAGPEPWRTSGGAAGLGPSYAGQSPFAAPGYGPPPGYGQPPGYVPPLGYGPPPSGGSMPPPGMSSAPLSGPAPYLPAGWSMEGQGGQPPGPVGASEGPQPATPDPDPGSGPWIADPVTGAWSPAPRAAPPVGPADPGQRPLGADGPGDGPGPG